MAKLQPRLEPPRLPVWDYCSLNTPAEMVNKSIASVAKRAEMYLEVSGGHF